MVAAMSRNYNDELQFLEKINKNCWRIKKGFVPNMQVRRGSTTEWLGLPSWRPAVPPGYPPAFSTPSRPSAIAGAVPNPQQSSSHNPPAPHPLA